MCEQCVAKAKMISSNILDGWFLVRATRTGNYMTKGQYGIGRCNNPDFIFDGPIETYPTINMTDKKINRLNKKDLKQWEKFNRWYDQIRDSFDINIETGYEFYKACMKKGYRPKKDGYNVLMWFLSHLTIFIKQ